MATIERSRDFIHCPYDATQTLECPALAAAYELATERADSSVIGVDFSHDTSELRVETLMRGVLNNIISHRCDPCESLDSKT